MKSMVFRETSPDVAQNWHPESRRQYGITLEGEVDVSLSDGTTRRFAPGEVFLAEHYRSGPHIAYH